MNPTVEINPLASLYVGDLHPDVTEQILYEKFSKYGTVISIRVCRDMIKRQSLGYAYVNFQLEPDAKKAMEASNFELLLGRSMRIMHRQRDSLLRNTGLGNIFIKNLDKSIDNKTLYDTFSSFGNILSSKIVTDENGSKGYGFVHFESEEDAQNCIKKTNGMVLNGKIVFVGIFLTYMERMRQLANIGFTNVYIKNFADVLNDETLRKLFEKSGRVINAKVMTDGLGKSKGFGFVRLSNSKVAEKAVKEINGTEINGRKVYAGRAYTKYEKQSVLKDKFLNLKMPVNEPKVDCIKKNNLYVKNLDVKIDDDLLRKNFSKFGKITSAKVMTENGYSKGFGFVCFSDPEDANKAATEMNGRIVNKKKLYVSLAQSKEERRVQLTSIYSPTKRTLSL